MAEILFAVAGYTMVLSFLFAQMGTNAIIPATIFTYGLVIYIQQQAER